MFDKKWNIPLDIKSVGMSNLILKVFLKVCFSLTVIIMATVLLCRVACIKESQLRKHGNVLILTNLISVLTTSLLVFA